MKKILAIILAGLMLISLVACGGKKDDVNVMKFGVIEGSGLDTVDNSVHNAHMKETYGSSVEAPLARVNYDNLSTALMDLESGKIKGIGIEKSTAEYIAAHNDKVIVDVYNQTTNFSMMTMENNKEVFDILDNAIKEIKADGTLDALVENELKAYIESDPVAKDLPTFEGAKTIKIGVTGDLPPMDYVASNGKAAGFNIALLTEIANRAQVNIELVQIESGARPMALSSDKVDAVFWTKSVTCAECGETLGEAIEGTLVTESYFSDITCAVFLKSDK